jgi:ATP-binding cassette, subfamily B, multidrug efflux pump
MIYATPGTVPVNSPKFTTCGGMLLNTAGFSPQSKMLYFPFIVLKEFATLLQYFKRYRYRYLAGVFFLALTNLGQLAIPQFVKRVVDMISSGLIDMRMVFWYVLGIVGMAVAVAVGRLGWRIFILGVSRRIEKGLRDQLFTHLLKLSGTFYGKMKTGDILARATNDMTNVRNASGMGLVSAIDGSFMTVAILAIMFAGNPRLAALTIIPAPIVTVLVLSVGRLLGEKFRKVQEGFSRLSEHVQETLSGIRVIKSFVREDHFTGIFDQRNAHFLSRNMSLVKIWGLFFPLITFLSGLTALLLLYFGGSAVIDGSFSPGEFVAFLAYLQMLIWPMWGAGYMVNMIQRGGASLRRINEILQSEPDIVGPAEGTGRNRVESSDIRVNSLSFTYPGTDKEILSKVSFHVPEGSTLGLLGRTGSGKSTLIRCLPRLIDPPEGSVYIGNQSIHDYVLPTLRSSFGMVPQETFLFSATVRENIAFGSPDVSEADIREAASLSTIDRDLSEFPDGFDTQVGERGITLSGGQKQRIAISRAVLMNPQILIFDDALSAVDAETEAAILEAFLEKRHGRTSILISQRISTLDHADSVIVLDNGEIVQSGTPSALAVQEGLYREIYTLQLMEKEADA